MSKRVLDASALLALLNEEPGAEKVAQAVSQGALVSTVNLSEVVGKLCEAGMPENEVHQVLDLLNLELIAFDADLAYRAGVLRPLTRQQGLSLADRACLALGQRSGLPVVTADRTWEGLRIGVVIVPIR